MGVWSTQMIQINCIVKLAKALIRSRAQSSTKYSCLCNDEEREQSVARCSSRQGSVRANVLSWKSESP